MAQQEPGWKNWGDHPFVVALTIISALIAIAVFITGKQNLPSFLTSSSPISDTNPPPSLKPTPSSTIVTQQSNVVSDPRALPSATATPVRTTLPRIDWRALEQYYEVQNIKIDIKSYDTEEIQSITFIVEAKCQLGLIFFKARFYDEDNIEIHNPQIVSIMPPQNWSPGTRGRGEFLLPPKRELSKVKLIKLLQAGPAIGGPDGKCN